jgi:hypothetical protein
MWRAHHTRGTPIDVELDLRRRDGEWRRIHARGRIAELDAEGRPLRSIGTITEISPETTDAGADLLEELGAPLASLFSSAELVVAADPAANGRSRAADLLDASRSRVADAFSAARDVAEMRANPGVPVPARDVVRVAVALAGREVEMVQDPTAEEVIDPADAVLRLREALRVPSVSPIRLSFLPTRSADKDHRFESDTEGVRVAFSSKS